MNEKLWALIDEYADAREEYRRSTARHLAKPQRENVEHAKAELTAALAGLTMGEPVAWMRDNGQECRTDAEKKHMESLQFGLWQEIAKQYTTPLYAEPVATLAGDAILQAAKVWWEGKRPVVYSEQEHIAAARVNCITDGEMDLAVAVAAYVAGSTPSKE